MIAGAVLVGMLVAATGAALLAAGSGRRSPLVAHEAVGETRSSAPPRWFASAWPALAPGPSAEEAWPRVQLGAVLSAAVVAVSHPEVLAVGAGLLAVAPTMARLRAASRRRRPLADLPAAVDALVAALAAGASPLRAVASVAGGEASADLGRVVRTVDRGSTLQEALDRWATAHPRADARLVADAVALAGTRGGSLVEALRGVGDTLRDREAVARETRALAAQARMSAQVLVVAPVGFAGLMAVADPGVRHVLTATPLGWACAVVGLLLDLAGWRWMRAVTARVAS